MAEPGVSLALARDVTLWQAEVWPDRFAAASGALATALGVALPPPGRSVAGGFGRLWRAAPLVWRLLDTPGEGPPPAFAGIGPETGAVAELGPGLARLTVAGIRAPELLARAVTLDLRPAAFPLGAVATTGWREATVTLLRAERMRWDLLAPLSHGDDALAALEVSARQFA